MALLPSTSKEDAIVTAERIRRRISELVIQTRTNEGEAIAISERTASIGVASFPMDGTSVRTTKSWLPRAPPCTRRSTVAETG